VASTPKGIGDVGDDLAGSLGVGSEVAVDGGDATRCRRVEVAGVAESGGVHVQHRIRLRGVR
jgi:hypothetical protein